MIENLLSPIVLLNIRGIIRRSALKRGLPYDMQFCPYWLRWEQLYLPHEKPSWVTPADDLFFMLNVHPTFPPTAQRGQLYNYWLYGRDNLETYPDRALNMSSGLCGVSSQFYRTPDRVILLPFDTFPSEDLL